MTDLFAFILRILSFNGDGALLMYIVVIGHVIISQLISTAIPGGFEYHARNILIVALHLIHDIK